MQTLLQHKLLLIIAGVIIAGLVWYGLSPTAELPDLTSTPIAADGSPSDPGIVPTLLTLRAVKLDGTILSSDAFKQLKDFSTEIVPEPVGRTNPFAPLFTPNTPNSTSTQNLRTSNP